MKCPIAFLLAMTLYVAVFENSVKGQRILWKNFIRPGRASRPADDFDNFFLKASKSVPRIGRRDFDMNANYYAGSSGYYTPNAPITKLNKKLDTSLKGLIWTDLADKVEYYPELFLSPGLLVNDEFRDPNDFVLEEKRLEAPKIMERNKEITEYRLQPES